MKKALIISYYWPPSGGAGVQRWLKFVKYLREFDWEPVIFTPQNPEYPETDFSLEQDIPADLEILKYPIWEPYSAYKKLLGQKKDQKINAAFLSEKQKNATLENFSIWIRGNFFIPDARRFWIKPSIRYLKKWLHEHPVDVIISTGPPHSMHLIAQSISKKFGLPWLADFRDPWTNIDFYHDLRLSKWANNKHHTLELRVLKKATAVTVISQTMADNFSQIYPRTYKVITNGYDGADIENRKPASLDEKFSIAHIGTLVSSRNPISLWKALSSLLIEEEQFGKDLEIKLVGKVDYSVTASLAEFGLTSLVTKINYLPHDEVTRLQQSVQVLLLIINNTPNSKMILTGKLFEYLAAGRPILCVGPPDGDAADILSETKSGLLSDFQDIETMKKNILYYYHRYKSGIPATYPVNISKYSRKELTGDLATILNQISLR
ncbi:MAG: glycosyltransferase family 4 protein [Bacteroidales bacterium]|nr:glycosyltransferase family 4 protein [Bacteroidales bacterium]